MTAQPGFHCRPIDRNLYRFDRFEIDTSLRFRSGGPVRPDAAHRAVTDGRIFQPIDDFAHFGCAVDMWHDDATGAIVERLPSNIAHVRERLWEWV